MFDEKHVDDFMRVNAPRRQNHYTETVNAFSTPRLELPTKVLDRQLLTTMLITVKREGKTRRGCEYRKSDSRAKKRFKSDIKEKTEWRAEKSTQVSLLLSRGV
jgi:hypothetical protein